MPNYSLQCKNLQSDYIFDIQLFIEKWEYNNTKYLNFQVFIEGEMVNLQPYKIPYVLAEELYYSVIDSSLFDIQNDLSKDLITKFTKEKSYSLLNYIEECFEDLLVNKNFEQFQDSILLIHIINNEIGLSIEESIEQYNSIQDFVSKFNFYLPLNSEKSVPKLRLYSIDELKYLQFTNISVPNNIFQIKKIDYENLYRFIKEFSIGLGLPATQ